MQIGPYTLNGQVMLAPMAGVTDRPFRQLARHFGAALATSEMTSADPTLWQTEKSRLRRDHDGEAGPISVQIAGYCPDMLAEAARFNVDHGAQIIDINLGCPAKKVCRVDAGSALMRDPALVRAICEAVVAAVPVPVTLKMRTGYCPQQKNALALALMAEASGIQALAIHGRTRDQQYNGAAEHETVALIKSQVDIPVIANGDLDTPQRCDQVLRATGCDAVMLGRAAQGRPWIFAEINHFLATGVQLPPPDVSALAAAFWAISTRSMPFMASRAACAWRASTSAGPAAACRVVRRSGRRCGRWMTPHSSAPRWRISSNRPARWHPPGWPPDALRRDVGVP